MSTIPVHRRELQFFPDSARVLIRPFIPTNPQRVVQIIGRALAMSEEEAEREVTIVMRDFSGRHLDIEALLHGRELIIPYAMSDKATLVSAMLLDDLLQALLPPP